MTGQRSVSWSGLAIGLLMILQVGGCMVVGTTYTMPILCTAAASQLEWFASIQSLLLLGFFPLGLAALAVPKMRPIAIAIGIVAVAGVAAQYSYLEKGSFHCDGP